MTHCKMMFFMKEKTTFVVVSKAETYYLKCQASLILVGSPFFFAAKTPFLVGYTAIEFSIQIPVAYVNS